MKVATALLAGLLFGLGLLLSGMTNPANVLGFLDVAGDWRPALAFTMVGAILVATPAFRYIRLHQRALAGGDTVPPKRKSIDTRLVIGSTVFGVGWGLSGLCPGPALIVLTGRTVEALVFVASLAVGMLLARLAPR